MLRIILTLVTLPLTAPIKLVVRLLRPRRIVKKTALISLGVAAAAAHQRTRSQGAARTPARLSLR